MRRTIPKAPSRRAIRNHLEMLRAMHDNNAAVIEQKPVRRSTPKKQAESAVNDAVIALWRTAQHGTLYRNRRGMASLPNGGMFPYGLGPNGTGDEIGWTLIRITPAMLNQVLPIYTEFEAKTETGRLEEHQIQRIESLKDINAICGCVRSAEDAAEALRRWLERVGRDQR